jgi:hypothetical protein
LLFTQKNSNGLKQILYQNDQTKMFGSLAFLGLWKSKSSDDAIKATTGAANTSTGAQSHTMQNSADSISNIPPSSASSPANDIASSGGYIPEPPPIIDESIVFNSLGEATLQSLGLGSYFTPVGWVQNLVEVFHVNLDLPWFQAIALLAVVMRTCLFPIQVQAQKNAVLLRKIGPDLARLNEKLTDAKISGNSLDSKL